MRTIARAKAVDLDRRRLVGTAAMFAAAAELGIARTARAQSGGVRPVDAPASRPASPASFGPLKAVDAGVLNVGYAELGPADGPAVILLHGWPYDINSFADVAPLLAPPAIA